MPAWFKTPLDFINKVAEAVYYAQEVNILDIFVKLNATLDALLRFLQGDTGDGGASGEVATTTIPDDGQVNIINIFPAPRDGEYLVFRKGDAGTWMRFQFNRSAPNDAVVLDGSANVVISDVDGNLCLLQVGNEIAIKNRLGNEFDFIVHRRA